VRGGVSLFWEVMVGNPFVTMLIGKKYMKDDYDDDDDDDLYT